jgi:hypothetical protein
MSRLDDRRSRGAVSARALARDVADADAEVPNESRKTAAIPKNCCDPENCRDPENGPRVA